MKQAMRGNSAAVAISLLALFGSLAGSVYAAGRARLDGRAIAVKSLPGNRLKPGSVPANRLRPGTLRNAVASTPLTGAEIDERTLARVPSAEHAESADSAQRAVEAETALTALNAIDAETVNGHGVGCLAGMLPFGGGCWQASPSAVAATAPEAAADCAAQGGTLPGALELAAFAKEPGVTLDGGGEWTGDLTNVSGLDLYGVITVSSTGGINSTPSSGTRKYRCAFPLIR